MSKFNSKDYNFVAKRIREHFPLSTHKTYADNQVRAAMSLLALDFAKAYLKDNELFQPVKFLNACSPNIDELPLGELWDAKRYMSV